jgi:hypothetical protein
VLPLVGSSGQVFVDFVPPETHLLLIHAGEGS